MAWWSEQRRMAPPHELPGGAAAGRAGPGRRGANPAARARPLCARDDDVPRPTARNVHAVQIQFKPLLILSED